MVGEAMAVASFRIRVGTMRTPVCMTIGDEYYIIRVDNMEYGMVDPLAI